jgi:hypothetical protein
MGDCHSSDPGSNPGPGAFINFACFNNRKGEFNELHEMRSIRAQNRSVRNDGITAYIIWWLPDVWQGDDDFAAANGRSGTTMAAAAE